MTFVKPAFPVISALIFVPPGEVARLAFVRVAEVFPQDAGGVGKINDVLAEEQIVLNHVPNESTKERNIAPGSQRHPNIGQRARARKSRIDMNDRRAPF